MTVPVQSPDSVCRHTRVHRWTCPHPTLQQELLGNIFVMESAGGALTGRGFKPVLPPAGSPQRPVLFLDRLGPSVRQAWELWGEMSSGSPP